MIATRLFLKSVLCPRKITLETRLKHELLNRIMSIFDSELIQNEDNSCLERTLFCPNASVII